MMKPLNGLILVEEIKDQEVTKAGIVIAETRNKHKLQKAKVVAVGDGFPLPVTLNLTVTGNEKESLQQLIDMVKDGVPNKVNIGDIVVYKTGQGTEIRVEDKDLVLINEIHLMGVM